MSHVVKNAIERRRFGSGTLKAVMMYIAERASDDGSGIWTSKTHMAADLELSKRCVQMAMARLIGMGVIAETGPRKCGNGYAVVYRVVLEAVERLPATTKAKRDGE